MELFDIELYDQNESEQEEIQLPLNCIQEGTVSPQDVKVYISQRVYKELNQYASSDVSCELGAILVGNYVQNGISSHVIVSDYIIAKHTDHSAATLTFTHETWNDVFNELEQKYSGKKIVGWYHTHPDYGVFLSGYDLFIQENFFNLPFQIAYVNDPVRNQEGIFQWKNGKVEVLDGFFVYDEVGTSIDISKEKGKGLKTAKQKKKSPAFKAAVILLILALLILAVLLQANVLRETKKQTETIENNTNTYQTIEINDVNKS